MFVNCYHVCEDVKDGNNCGDAIVGMVQMVKMVLDVLRQGTPPRPQCHNE